jgi:hypothetical protein
MRAAVIAVTVALAWSAAVACSGGHDSLQDASVTIPSIDAGAGDAEAGMTLGQVDRAGRPLIAVLLIPGTLQDDYNGASTFDAGIPRTLQDALTSRLHALDTIALGDAGPDPVDWPIEGGTHPLVPILSTDALLVDTARPCVLADGGFASSYLDIERELFPYPFSAAAHWTCGGRTPPDDVVDTTLSLLVTADRDGGPAVRQGVSKPTKPATTTFPYLAEPN